MRRPLGDVVLVMAYAVLLIGGLALFWSGPLWERLDMGTPAAAAWVSALGTVLGVGVAAAGVWLAPTLADRASARKARRQATYALKACAEGVAHLGVKLRSAVHKTTTWPPDFVAWEVEPYRSMLQPHLVADTSSDAAAEAFARMGACLNTAEAFLSDYNRLRSQPYFSRSEIDDKFPRIQALAEEIAATRL
ncbi:hypothetical protein D3C73_688380 [compost metagenome]